MDIQTYHHTCSLPPFDVILCCGIPAIDFPQGWIVLTDILSLCQNPYLGRTFPNLPMRYASHVQLHWALLGGFTFRILTCDPWIIFTYYISMKMLAFPTAYLPLILVRSSPMPYWLSSLLANSFKSACHTYSFFCLFIHLCGFSYLAHWPYKPYLRL